MMLGQTRRGAPVGCYRSQQSLWVWAIDGQIPKVTVTAKMIRHSAYRGKDEGLPYAERGGIHCRGKFRFQHPARTFHGTAKKSCTANDILGSACSLQFFKAALKTTAIHPKRGRSKNSTNSILILSNFFPIFPPPTACATSALPTHSCWYCQLAWRMPTSDLQIQWNF